MNSITDPSKKTSINSLLNPEASSTSFSASVVASANQAQPHHPHHADTYTSPFVNGSSFHLRAADWGISDDPAKRKLENGGRYHYQHSPDSSPIYPAHTAPRILKTRDDVYAMEGQVWQAHQDVAYATPVIAPMYSDERTVLSGDYPSHSNFPQAYQEQGPPGMPQAWQTTERASVRLAARGSVQDPRYGDAAYYHVHAPGNGLYAAPLYAQHPPPPPQQQQQQHQEAQYSQPSQPQLPPQQQLPRVVQPPPEKRQLSEEGESAPRSKRSKSTVAKASGQSKRGYNAKKRSEAAQIAAQQAQMIPAVSYTPMAGEKGKQKADDSPTTIVPTEASGAAALVAELQFARCMSNRYKNDSFPRCVSCTRRWAGDTCRFQNIRFFVKDAQRNIVGISFVEAQKADLPTMDFPMYWNVSLKPHHINRTKKTIAQALLPVLQKEREHLKLPELIHRPRESDVRATCDTCMTSIFSTSWMCRLCGREACAECFDTVTDITTDRPGANHAEAAALQLRRERHAHNNPFFLACTRRNEHQAKDFSPMSRFNATELEKAIEEMEKLLKEELGDVQGGLALSSNQNGQDQQETLSSDLVPTGPVHPSLQKLSEAAAAAANANAGTNSANDANAAARLPDAGGPPLNTNGSGAAGPAEYLPPNLAETVVNTPTLPLQRFADGELTEANFPGIWALGQPLVVTGVGSRFKIEWTPEYFIEKYGTQGCLIIECQTEVNKRITVGEFFKDFGKYEGRTECWKLKDWPPSTDFKTAFPELYEDFSRVVPVPSYVRRDGVLNLASHFPTNTIAPDLGPKMYNAMASNQNAGSKGSTRLHMDMADALNIMTFSSPCPDGSPGCAVWDLFRAEDSDRLRAFLNKKFGHGKTRANGDGAGNLVPGSGKRAAAAAAAVQPDWGAVNDPIHGQQFYLDEELKAVLFKETGVKSYRFYQRPGEAVFIPAGCAHQVANLADCIKVAIDFVSPENIERCEKLTKEFREQNQRKVWKEDVLQLRTMMWFAWLSCRQQEEDMEED